MLDVRLFPPEFRGNYPHMFPNDKEVWERFLNKYGNNYKGFYYDVICGEESERFPHWKENYQKMARILSKLRIDAVGVKENGVDIIEVKPRGNMAAVGQLLTYRKCYMEEYKPTGNVEAIIVCKDIDPNIIPVADANGIKYITV